MKSKIAFAIMAIAMMLGLQGCDHDKATISTNNLTFNAINLTVDKGQLSATAGTPVTVNWTVNVTVNGETTTLTGTSKSDELPVMAGDEIEIQFTPSCPEQTEANFTLPDGTTHKATASSPSFKWTVPADFTPGMQIKDESHYETDEYKYNQTGAITLIELK